ncbi:hypothetical protein [Ralstonia sp. SET104]|jgi:hypothetical protein|uniref:hypothetical protein n=1 Tax=Ralstonia sp. SET104 TaxID=2448774 RepID=UPI000F5603D2|nr:hypothetical protein [Ralstonia sp. SET104]
MSFHAIPRRALAASIIAISLSQTCHALGVVSRSCLPAGAQESITVDWGFKPHQLWTASEHHRNGAFLHVVNTVSTSPNTGGWQNTWRSYAGHLGSEFWYGTVIGYHWGNSGGAFFLHGITTASDCNLSQWGTS